MIRIREIIIGLQEGAQTRAFRAEIPPVPHVVLSGELVDDEPLVSALRSLLDGTPPDGRAARLPFLRIDLETDRGPVVIMQDAAQGVRVVHTPDAPDLTLPLDADPAAWRALRIAQADRLGLASPEALRSAPTTVAPDAPTATATIAGPAARFQAEHRRRQTLHAAWTENRSAMARSVVPDWIWWATGIGGVGVLMTAVALLWPEMRRAAIPVIAGGSLLGFGLYAALARREVRRRGAIQAEHEVLEAELAASDRTLSELEATLRNQGIHPQDVLPKSDAASAMVLVSAGGPEQLGPWQWIQVAARTDSTARTDGAAVGWSKLPVGA